MTSHQRLVLDPGRRLLRRARLVGALTPAGLEALTPALRAAAPQMSHISPRRRRPPEKPPAGTWSRCPAGQWSGPPAG